MTYSSPLLSWIGGYTAQLHCTPLQTEMSSGYGASGDSWCSGCLVSCSNSHIIRVATVVRSRHWVSLTGVMMLPRRRETGRLMDRSRCPPPLTSPKHSHAWNWFCCYYLPVGLALFLCLSQHCTKKISHHKNTNEEHVNNRLMLSVYGLWFCCSKCVHDWCSCQRQVVDLMLFFCFF